MNARCLSGSGGKCRTDSSPRCGDRGNDAGYCGKVTGNPAIHACKISPEGSGLDLPCNRAFLKAACPLWFFSVDGGHSWERCLPDGIDAQGNPRQGGGAMSCDHFDDWSESDGPYRGICPASTFGLHAPITGYHTVPHGLGLVRACDVDQTVCSDPLSINY